MKVLLIGTVHDTTEMVVRSLRPRWPDVRALVAAQAREGLDMMVRELPDLAIVQSNFSDMSLAQLIEQIRQVSDIPLVVLAKEEEDLEAIRALVLGADDYIRSPYGREELRTHVEAVLRRVEDSESLKNIEAAIRNGSFVINPVTYEIFLGDRRLLLTPTEFRVLYLLVQKRGQEVSHRTLQQALWADQVGSASLVRQYIRRLRRKLGDDARKPHWIANVHGIGYRFVGPPNRTRNQNL